MKFNSISCQLTSCDKTVTQTAKHLQIDGKIFQDMYSVLLKLVLGYNHQKISQKQALPPCFNDVIWN